MMLTIRGLPTLNEYINIERSNKYAAAKMKKSATNMVAWEATAQLKPIAGKCEYMFIWNEPTTRRDPDNIAFAKKFILDGMVAAGIIKNDGWKNIGGFVDRFVHHKGCQSYVEVRIHEVKK